eukprot:g15145.t1
MVLFKATLVFRKYFLQDWEKLFSEDLGNDVASVGESRDSSVVPTVRLVSFLEESADGSIPEIGRDFFFVPDFQELLTWMK